MTERQLGCKHGENGIDLGRIQEVVESIFHELVRLWEVWERRSKSSEVKRRCELRPGLKTIFIGGLPYLDPELENDSGEYFYLLSRQEMQNALVIPLKNYRENTIYACCSGRGT